MVDENYRGDVLPEWIDGNGHMNVAYYVLAIDRASDRLFDRLGVGEAYRLRTNHSIFALEAHVTYAQQLLSGESFAIETRLVDADEKRLHLFHLMTRQRDGARAATVEVMGLHVDLAGPKAAPMPPDLKARVDAMVAAQRDLPLPPELGRKIGMRR